MPPSRVVSLQMAKPPSSMAPGPLRLLAINLVVLVGLLLLAELSYRGFRLHTSCRSQRGCDLGALANPPSTDVFGQLRLSVYDPVVGYRIRGPLAVTVPRQLAPEWHGASISTDSHGFRLPGPLPMNHGPAAGTVLAVGDSFTFGDQVNDHETWPACLARNLPRQRVINAGVFGYGAAQSLRRAEQLAPTIQPQLVLWSVLLGSDFGRDQMAYRSGFPRPAVIQSNGGLAYAPVSKPDVAGSKFEQQASPSPWLRMGRWASDHVWLVRQGLETLTPSWHRLALKRRTERDPRAAPLPAIIDWSIARAAQGPVPVPVMLVLQYPAGISPQVRQERTLALQAAQRHGVPVVDTFTAVHGPSAQQAGSLYTVHHTPAGNLAVCRAILAAPALQAIRSHP